MNFIEILEQLKIDYARPGESHHVTEGWIGIDCPYCSQGSRKYKLGYNTNFGYLSCWSCGGFKLERVLMDICSLPYGEIKSLTSGIERVYLPKEKLSGTLKLPRKLGKLDPSHISYLRSRNFDPDSIVKLWGIQGIGLSGYLKWRIFIPIMFRGETVSWTTRSISDEGCRYISAKNEQEKIPHKELLYGEDYVKNTIVVCEGPTDVWRIGPGSVATLGALVGPLQCSRIASYPRRVVCFDSDRTGQRRAKKLVRELSVFPGETYNICLDSKDPGSATPKEISYIRRRFLS